MVLWETNYSTRWTWIVFISYWLWDHSVFHINPCRTVPLGDLQRIQCQQTSPCALSYGIYLNWNSYPILYQLFHLCQFCPWVNFALHWFPSSWVICSNLCLITPSLMDEVLWPPAPLVIQWNRHRWYCKMWQDLTTCKTATTCLSIIRNSKPAHRVVKCA